MWPRITCPSCQELIVDPKWRFRSLFGPMGRPCPYCNVKVVFRGNLWLGYFIGGGLLILGGRLSSQGYSSLLATVFFLAGTATVAWGIATSQLVVMHDHNKDS